MTLDESLRAAVGDVVAPLVAELAGLREQVAALLQSNPPQLLSVADAAQRMGVCAATIRRMCASGELVHRRCGRRIVVSVESIKPTDPSTVARLAREART
jgi:excisionase family DNA binding protein